VFNMGIGMVLIVRPAEEKKVLDYFKKKPACYPARKQAGGEAGRKEKIFSIGVVKSGSKKVIIN